MLSRSMNTFLSVGLNGWTAGASLEVRRHTTSGPMSRVGPALPARWASEGNSSFCWAHNIRIERCGGASGASWTGRTLSSGSATETQSRTRLTRRPAPRLAAMRARLMRREHEPGVGWRDSIRQFAPSVWWSCSAPRGHRAQSIVDRSISMEEDLLRSALLLRQSPIGTRKEGHSQGFRS
jgi:hypothetical protein